ncbi:MAG: hypothetical protein AAFX76_13050, partial [Planctomycetota bacterium]
GEQVVDADPLDTGPLPRFWTATGFTPPQLIADERMRVQLAHFDGVVGPGIEWVRVHDLLTLVRVRDADTATQVYDWSGLDAALDTMLDAGLRPFFEVMGRPEGFTFTDAHDPAQLAAWRRLVRDLARHLIDRYGREEVRSWVFEVWNEPDVFPWFDHPWAEDDVAGLIRYYDATSAGLMDADPGLRFGGPGTAEQLSVMFTGLMQHLDTGTNHLTGQSPPRCDFISVHVKGGSYSKTPADPSMDTILTNQRELSDYLAERHPRLAALPMINNEGDPRVGWRTRHAWRGTSYYASFIARMVHRHLDEAVRGPHGFELLSHDFGFLGDWSQRSVMVPFALAADGTPAAADAPADPDVPPGVSMVKKPVLEVMTLLSLLGDRTVAVEGPDPDGPLRCLASRTPAGDLVLLLTHHDDDSSTDGVATINLRLDHENPDWPQVSVLRIDPQHTAPFAAWEAAGRPATPSPEQLAALRDAAELVAEPAELRGNALSLDLPMHGVALVILSREAAPADPPPAPRNVRARVSPGLHGEEVLVRWQHAGDPRRLLGHRVEALSPNGEARPLHDAPIVSTTLIRPLPPDTAAVRVTPIDWHRQPGPGVTVPVVRPVR